jgi:glucan phosphoethanolaminetransferase (alkaline phosphatase superfamily)
MSKILIILKKIAFGAYCIEMEKRDNKSYAHFTAKLIVGAAPTMLFLVLSFFYALLFKGLFLYPFWYLIVLFFLIVIFIPIKRKDMDSLWETEDNEFRREAKIFFWLGMFGPTVLLIIVLVILKLLHRL